VEDEKNLRSFFKLMNISDKNIVIEIDLTYKQMNDFLEEISKIYLQASNHPSKKILCFVWYGGHGEMFDGSASTQVVLNGSDQEKRRFELEK
jgi:hypothetical protein